MSPGTTNFPVKSKTRAASLSSSADETKCPPLIPTSRGNPFKGSTPPRRISSRIDKQCLLARGRCSEQNCVDCPHTWAARGHDDGVQLEDFKVTHNCISTAAERGQELDQSID